MVISDSIIEISASMRSFRAALVCCHPYNQRHARQRGEVAYYTLRQYVGDTEKCRVLQRKARPDIPVQQSLY